MGTSLSASISLVSSLHSAPAKAQESVVAEEYIGVWDGQGIQENNAEWSILVTLVPGGTDDIVGTIAYPSLRCGGELTLASLDNDSLELLERLTYGNDRCTDRGTVTLTLVSNTRIDYEWLHPDESRGAEGVIRKISDR